MKPAPKAATWTLIRQTKGYTFLVTQPETVGAMKRMWLASISDKEMNGIAQTNALFEIDCTQNRVRYLQEDQYSGTGDVVEVKPIEDPNKWYYPNPDVVARHVVDMGCGRTPITGAGFDTLKDARQAGVAKRPMKDHP